MSEHRIEFGSIYGMQTQQGLVEMVIDGIKIQMTLDKARELRGMLDGAIEAALSDGLLVQFLRDKVRITEPDRIAMALSDFRMMRQGSRGTVWEGGQ